MDTSGLSEMILPRRNSAKIASAAFAEQLDDSDSPNGGSDGEPEPFSVASARNARAPVKRTYGKVRKRSGSERGEAPKCKSKRTRSPSVPLFVPPPRPKSSLSALAVAANSSHEPPVPRPRPRPIPKKIPASALISTLVEEPEGEDDLSDLTSLVSTTRSMSPEIVIVKDVNHPPPSQSASLPARLGLTHDEQQRNDSAWSLKNLDSYVWVLIEPKSARVFNPEEDGDDDKERLWWPGKINSLRVTDIPLKIKLFGTGLKTVEIRAPCETNILSKLDSLNRWRFRTPAFVLSSSLEDGLASPRKKSKRDREGIKRKWTAAVNEMTQDCEEQEGSDYLPEVGELTSGPLASASHTVISTLLFQRNSENGGRQGKRKREDIPDGGIDDGYNGFAREAENQWVPPPLDEELEIPGELVLARDRAAASANYWPAKIMTYIPPATRKQQAKFTITWLDGSTQNIPRSWFYTWEEDGYMSCKLGKFTSVVVEVQNDDENEDEQYFHSDPTQRSPSPIPHYPPPSADEFNNLSIREQFAYTKDVLRAILNYEYEPAKRKHTQFMNGGRDRRNVTEAGSLRGRMDPKDVEHLQTYVREWCLRDGGRAAVVFEDEIQNGDVTKPTGIEPKAQDEDVQQPGSWVMGNDMHSDTGRCSSPPIMDPIVASSPPPSSCPSSRVEPEESFVSDVSTPPLIHDPSLCSVAPSVSATEPPSTSDAVTDDLPDLTNIDEDQTVPEAERPTRQHGCDEFESLDPKTKVDYCLNILGPESIRQILLWRTGVRTSMELLSPEEEQDLFDKGETLLHERDWVYDILRMREKLVRNKAIALATQKGAHRGNGSSSRPRRGAASVNYQE